MIKGWHAQTHEDSLRVTVKGDESTQFALHIHIASDGALQVFAHRIDSDGNERRPNGYVLGSNALLFDS